MEPPFARKRTLRGFQIALFFSCRTSHYRAERGRIFAGKFNRVVSSKQSPNFLRTESRCGLTKRTRFCGSNFLGIWFPQNLGYFRISQAEEEGSGEESSACSIRFLLAKFGADMPCVNYITRCNLMQLGIYSIYVIRKETWGKPKKTALEKGYVASRPCDRFECG